ncbi:TPA: hypothetical protein I8Z61_001260 [Legionella pneumophila]|nr:hypothetical protein [Legionella pneumophila]
MSFKLLDHYGEYCEIINSATSQKPYINAKTELNPTQHFVSSTMKYNDDDCRFNLSLQSINTIIEHSKGANVLTLNEHPTLKLADKIIETFDEDSLKKIDRIGFRTWIIFIDKKFTFDKLKETFIENNTFLKKTSIKNNIDDLAIVFETKQNDVEQSRICLGPYRESEFKKYFSVANQIKEGFILDIDIWQKNCEIPKLSLEKNSRHYFQTINETAINLYERLKEVINV